MSRLIMNTENIWECPKCGSFNIKGNKCNSCKISYFDKLRDEEKQTKKERKKPRKPYIPETVSESGILESFMKRKKER